MSAGHGAKRVHLGEDEYNKALHDPRLQALLSRGFQVNDQYDIPYLGGYSRDGATIYLDKDVPPQFKNGNRTYPGQMLMHGVIVHEHWEKSILDAWGWKYPEAHELATHAEHIFVREQLGIDPDDYEKMLHPVIKNAEKKLGRKDIQLPPDLDPAAYNYG